MQSKLRNAFCKKLSLFASNKKGNIALTFALIVTPLILAVGCAVDFTRAYNVQSKMQTDLDSALIAAIKQVNNLNATDIQAKIQSWFAAQSTLSSTSYSISKVNVDTTAKTITASVAATVPTFFMQVAGYQNVPVSAVSAAAGPQTSYLQVYIVLDKSASMLLPSTQADRTTLYNLVYNNSYDNNSSKSSKNKNLHTTCEFACHDYDGVYFNYNKKWFNNIYDMIVEYRSASGNSLTLRTDTAITAAQQVVNMIAEANKTTSHIKAGLYYVGDSTYEALAPTNSTTSLTNSLKTDTRLTSATSQPVTFFDKALPALTKIVGTAGDGSSDQKPLKLVLLLTDGVESQRSWVLSGSSYYKYIAPLNPSWCDGLKTNGVTIGILNTDYLPITYDWGYNATLATSMNSSQWNVAWGATMPTGLDSSVTKRDYLKTALKGCASKDTLFLTASDKTDIENGLSTIFDQYLNAVRLTQ